MASSPIVARWELSRRLAALRKDRGLDVKAITDHLGFTRNYWSAVENDRTLIAADKLTLLLDLFEVDDAERAELTQLREHGRKRGWWDQVSAFGDESRRICGLEDGATRIRAYEGQLIPGLLQIPEYTTALIESDPLNSALGSMELVRARQTRREVLTRQPPVEFLALISEAVLLQQPAGAAVQSSQLQAIAELIEDDKSSVVVRVLPFQSNPGIIMHSSTLVFFEFEDRPHLPSLAWQESVRPLGYLDPSHDDSFRRLEMAWADGWARSMEPEASLDLIYRVASS